MRLLREFNAHRPLLKSIAYRMTGSAMDAEDLVQETYMRLERSDAGAIENPRAYLMTILTRLALDFVGSAYEKRKTYIGPWLPEPWSIEGDPASQFERTETLSTAFLVVLERLSPVERACFLLRDVFDMDYEPISRIVDKNEDNVRQIVARSRLRVREAKVRFDLEPSKKDALFDSFLEAVRAGNLEALMRLLASDARLYNDGGGRVTSARKPIFGPDRICRFLFGVRRKFGADLVGIPGRLNGEPALFLYGRKKLYSVTTFGYGTHGIVEVYTVLNPEKISGLRDPTPMERIWITLVRSMRRLRFRRGPEARMTAPR